MAMGKSVKRVSVDLQVHEALHDEVYKDIIRVYWEHRGDLEVNSIVKVIVNDSGPRYFAIRGLNPDKRDNVYLDWLGRRRLGELQLGEVYRFNISSTNPWEKLKWACLASDPASRIAAWIAVWSAVLGILGLVLGIISVIPVVKEWFVPPQSTHSTPISPQSVTSTAPRSPSTAASSPQPQSAPVPRASDHK